MYSIYIVGGDIEKRRHLIDDLRHPELTVEVLGSADDGATARLAIDRLRPDILIADARGRGARGGALTRITTPLHPDARRIMLVNADDIEALREALRTKADAVLLSPVGRDELLEAVRGQIDAIEWARTRGERDSHVENALDEGRREMARRLICAFARGHVRDAAAFERSASALNIRFDKARYACLVLPDPPAPDAGNFAPSPEQWIAEAIERCSGGAWDVYASEAPDGELVIVIGSDGEFDALDGIWDDPALAQRPTVAALGGAVSDIADIHQSYRDARMAYLNGPFRAEPAILRRAQAPPAVPFAYPIEVERELLRHIERMGDARIEALIKRLFDAMERRSVTRARLTVEMMGLIGNLSRKAEAAGIEIFGPEADPLAALTRFATRERLERFLFERIAYLRDEIIERRQRGLRHMIGQVDGYIDRYYMTSDISLESAAAHLNVNPSHLSRLYKRETGRTFVAKLTMTRMEGAKLLLTGSECKISDIAAKVGYQSAKYFSTTFHRYVGVTPMEYRMAREHE